MAMRELRRVNDVDENDDGAEERVLALQAELRESRAAAQRLMDDVATLRRTAALAEATAAEVLTGESARWTAELLRKEQALREVTSMNDELRRYVAELEQQYASEGSAHALLGKSRRTLGLERAALDAGLRSQVEELTLRLAAREAEVAALRTRNLQLSVQTPLSRSRARVFRGGSGGGGGEEEGGGEGAGRSKLQGGAE